MESQLNTVKAALVALCLLPLTVAAAENGKDTGDVWRKTLAGTKIENIQPEPRFPGVYEITMGNKIVYGDPTGRYLMFGHIYDVQTNEDLTQQKLDKVSDAKKVSWDDLPLNYAVRETHAPADAPKLAILFNTDCGWCKKLYDDVKSTKSSDGKLVKGLEYYADVRFLILAPEAAEWKGGQKPAGYDHYMLSDMIVCNELPPQALQLAMQDKAFQEKVRADAIKALYSPVSGMSPRKPQPDAAKPDALYPQGRFKPEQTCDGRKALSDVRGFAQSMGLTSTPTLISGDGRIHRGYLPKEELVKWLNQGKNSQ